MPYRPRKYQRKIQHLTIRYPYDLHKRAGIIAKTMRPECSLNRFLITIIEDGIEKYEQALGIVPEPVLEPKDEQSEPVAEG